MRPSGTRVHEIVSGVEPWDDLEVSQKADILTADPAVLDPYLPRFVAKLADLLTTPLSPAPSRPFDS